MDMQSLYKLKNAGEDVKMWKKLLPLLLCLTLTLPVGAVDAAREETFDLPCRAAVLIERSTGALLYGKNVHDRLAPASVTKIMTMLLAAEAVDNGSVSLGDTVTASAAAAAMGGSQVYLEEGEQMSVEEMLKCVAVVSANDCAVALSEFLCGSEKAFTARMNQRAAELGMHDTVFRNCTGLSGKGEHYSSAWDIAVMARELLRHEWIRDYTTIWTDSIRGGEFGLSNTNKLVRSYEGCTGLKTGYTSEAMFCLAASAEREGTEYIAVVLHGDSSADRFAAARTLLDYAFANYAVASLLPESPLPTVQVELGTESEVAVVPGGDTAVVTEKAALRELVQTVELPECVEAPVEKGQVLGRITLARQGELVAELPLLAECAVPRRSRGLIYRELLGQLFCTGEKMTVEKRGGEV